jgi:hypothetical protein
MQAGNAADKFSGLCIDDIDVVAARDVETMGWWIGQQVIPAAFAAQLPVVNDFVGLLRKDGANGSQKTAEQNSSCEGPANQVK